MAIRRLTADTVYRFYLYSPLAFADWRNPTAAELNANPTNDPNGLGWNLTCAISVNDSTHETDDPERDDSLTFCQDSSAMGAVISRGANIVWSFFLAEERWLDASSTLESDGFNTSTLAQSLLTWRGHEYFALMSVGKDPDAPFAVGDEIKMARVVTDYGVLEGGTGEKRRMTASFGDRGDLAWNVAIAS